MTPPTAWAPWLQPGDLFDDDTLGDGLTGSVYYLSITAPAGYTLANMFCQHGFIDTDPRKKGEGRGLAPLCVQRCQAGRVRCPVVSRGDATTPWIPTCWEATGPLFLQHPATGRLPAGWGASTALREC